MSHEDVGLCLKWSSKNLTCFGSRAMSVQGKDARCVVTRANLDAMMEKLNQSMKFEVDGIPIRFSIQNDGSRLLREYIDLLLMDVVKKYVKAINNETVRGTDNNRIQREEAVLDSIIRKSKQLVQDQIIFL